MARPNKERRIEKLPPITHYKPAGMPLRDIEEVVLSIEEMEAIRLADIELLDQSVAAGRMEVSRSTFNRIVNKAHQKIASALWQGYALRVDGGTFRVHHHCKQEQRKFICQTCGNKWSLPHGNGQSCIDMLCPACQSTIISRDNN